LAWGSTAAPRVAEILEDRAKPIPDRPEVFADAEQHPANSMCALPLRSSNHALARASAPAHA
jgi:hypothetical protein